MDYVVCAFSDAADWNRDNSYSSLTATSDGRLHLLSCPVPTVRLYSPSGPLLTWHRSASLLPYSHLPLSKYLLPIHCPFRNVLYALHPRSH
jgi:Mitochondrial distribution and morphology protein 10